MAGSISDSAKGAPQGSPSSSALGGLALVGLPLTLGYAAEDLLLHGTLETHPHLVNYPADRDGAQCLHVDEALHARLFLGQPGGSAGPAALTITDALPRERWVLTAAILFLIIGGLYPAVFVHLPARAAENLIHSVTKDWPVRDCDESSQNCKSTATIKRGTDENGKNDWPDLADDGTDPCREPGKGPGQLRHPTRITSSGASFS
jgi:hypothetical protein